MFALSKSLRGIHECRSQVQSVLPVPRTKKDAKRFYDRVSKFYDYLTGRFERKYSEMALERLSVRKGETVLEIGVGTGRCLRLISNLVDQTGRACGLDISSGMLEVTKRRLRNDEYGDNAELCQGDAGSLPYRDEAFDAVFMSFTLELFDTPEISDILHEVERVLRLGGRLGAVSMSKEGGQSMLLRLYEWAHKKWPKYVDCRPIYLEKSLRDAGYEIVSKGKERLFGLPLEVIIASRISRRASKTLTPLSKGS